MTAEFKKIPDRRLSEASSIQKLTQAQLETVLDRHQRWLGSKGKEGEKAVLCNVVLEGINLQGANLRMADLQGVNFKDANLQNADLTDTTGLQQENFGGSNLSGAKLPDSIRVFDGLLRVDEAAKSAQKFFFAMLLICVYSGLTIATTKDIPLLTNSATSQLPIIGTAVPIVGFYMVAPVLLLCFYAYFHLYLQRLWEKLAKLPAVFPDGIALDEKTYFWLLNGFVRSHFKQLKINLLPLSRVQTWLSVLLAWCSAPATLFLIWLRYLRRHDLLGTILHVVVLTVSIAAGLMFYRLAISTLRREKQKVLIDSKKQNRNYNLYKPALVSLVAIFFGFLSFGGIYGTPALIPRAFALMGYNLFFDLQEEGISIRPANWSEEDEKNVSLAKGAKLGNRNLRYANLSRTFLVKADLRGADLKGADLREANLIEADLRRANLQGADLRGAQFLKYLKTHEPSKVYYMGEGIIKADLRGAKLQNANLQDVDLGWVDLKEADLRGANLKGANLIKTNLQGANLQGVKGLTKAQLYGKKDSAHWGACNWIFAIHRPEFLEWLGYPADYNERLKKKDLSGLDFKNICMDKVTLNDANLQNANFQGASLLEADLQRVNLNGANLHDADLTWADLSAADLQGANLAGANLEVTILEDANLQNADLRGARIYHANLQRADLRYTLLDGIVGFNTTNAKLANLYGVEGDLKYFLATGGISESSDEKWEALKKSEYKDTK